MWVKVRSLIMVAVNFLLHNKLKLETTLVIIVDLIIINNNTTNHRKI